MSHTARNPGWVLRPPRGTSLVNQTDGRVWYECPGRAANAQVRKGQPCDRLGPREGGEPNAVLRQFGQGSEIVAGLICRRFVLAVALAFAIASAAPLGA